jgi:hypothetical protein
MTPPTGSGGRPGDGEHSTVGAGSGVRSGRPVRLRLGLRAGLVFFLFFIVVLFLIF